MKAPYKVCPWGTEIQTLLFPTLYFTKGGAKRWAIRNGFKSSGMTEEGKHYHIRQVDPSRFKKGSFRTIKLGGVSPDFVSRSIAAFSRRPVRRNNGRYSFSISSADSGLARSCGFSSASSSRE